MKSNILNSIVNYRKLETYVILFFFLKKYTMLRELSFSLLYSTHKGYENYNLRLAAKVSIYTIGVLE